MYDPYYGGCKGGDNFHLSSSPLHNETDLTALSTYVRRKVTTIYFTLVKSRYVITSDFPGISRRSGFERELYLVPSFSISPKYGYETVRRYRLSGRVLVTSLPYHTFPPLSSLVLVFSESRYQDSAEGKTK